MTRHAPGNDAPAAQGAPVFDRRQILGAGGRAALAAGGWGSLSLAGCEPPVRQRQVKVGILHSQTGTMAISETSLRDVELFAIDEINAAGGVLGREIVPVVENPRSRFDDLFPKKARKLLVEDQVAAIFGCWTSSSRKAVLPVLERVNGLLFYPLQYEGNESSRNVVYAGSAPNQQILPAVDWLLSDAGGSKRRFYLLGSDYVFPWTANYVVAKYLEQRHPEAAVVGKQYLPLGCQDFAAAVAAIQAAEPDVILSTLNGDSNVYFYNELAAQQVTADKLPVMATSVGEDELRGLLPEVVEGHLAAWHYFQTIDTEANRLFVRDFRQEHGEDRVLDDPMESAYAAVHLWKAAVEKAGRFEVDAVRAAFAAGVEFAAPGGTIRVDPKTQHCFKRCRIGRIRGDRQFDVVHASPESIAPDPYPAEAFPGWSCDWTLGGVSAGEPVVIRR